MEYQFHRSCYRDIVRIPKEKVVNSEAREQCFSELKCFIVDSIINKHQILTMDELRRII